MKEERPRAFSVGAHPRKVFASMSIFSLSARAAALSKEAEAHSGDGTLKLQSGPE
eukprot:CAMPEP_0175167060 /NCGR_PEP_ID=MMETSP0087-20121206/28095_1 /TAXON_ID=136419 /ORGANISM="Unknown Unknown, Strain D1" /LENGTH=54 /DNA_ID=CAMNT_0016456833 /DNA_START=158 /DNA_END=322 /DNA_ORIENTATION=-